MGSNVSDARILKPIMNIHKVICEIYMQGLLEEKLQKVPRQTDKQYQSVNRSESSMHLLGDYEGQAGK